MVEGSHVLQHQNRRTRLVSISDEDVSDTKRIPVEVNKGEVGRTSYREQCREESDEDKKLVKLVDLSQYSDVLISPSILVRCGHE